MGSQLSNIPFREKFLKIKVYDYVEFHIILMLGHNTRKHEKRDCDKSSAGVRAGGSRLERYNS